MKTNNFGRSEYRGDTCKCRECICEVCGCRDMNVCAADEGERGGSCLLWAVLALLTGGLALIFPLFFGVKPRKNGCACCARCGHVQPIGY